MSDIPVRRSLCLAILATALTVPAVFAQEADLMVAKSGPTQAPAGSDVAYTVTITNLGPDASLPITLDDPIPAGMTFVSAAPDPAFNCSTPAVGSGGIVSCSAPVLAADATASFTLVFNIPPATSLGTTFVNIATSSSPSDINSENDSGIAATSTPPPPLADMGVAKTGPSAAGPDTDVVYTLVVNHGGPEAAANAKLDDTLPGTMTFVSLQQSGTPMMCSTPAVGAGGTVSCGAASYPAGGSTTLTLTGHIPARTSFGTTFSNTGVVSSQNADPNDENNVSPTSLTVSTVDSAAAE